MTNIKEDRQTKIVRALYSRKSGRILLGMITKPWFSKACGSFMDTSLSRLLINSFVTKNNIDMKQYENRKYVSFNDFFTRKILSSERPVSHDPNDLISPCDAFLSVHRITGERVEIKGILYTTEELIRNRKLAEKYTGGTMLVFRLTVSDYHRYHYPDSGTKSENTKIDGILHTVHPIAAETRGIYRENKREYFVLDSDSFKNILMIQIGALLVGRICSRNEKATVKRGDEAGFFEYGGSTVILCLEKDSAVILPEFGEEERKVRMGQTIGKKYYGTH